jgi:hypothetical protein
MKKKIIFLHLPRTGGTTLRDILAKQYLNDVTFENKSLFDTDKILMQKTNPEWKI